METNWVDHFKKHVGMIPDKKRLVWMGAFLLSMGTIFSLYWLYDKEEHWWVAFVAMAGFYVFVLIMAYLLRKNP